MKFTIQGFSQAELIKLGLKSRDVDILRYIVDFYKSDKMKRKIINGDEYVWVFYDYLIKELPFMCLEKQTLVSIMKKLVTCGVLEFKLEKTKKGTYTFYRIVPEVYGKLVSGNTHS